MKSLVSFFEIPAADFERAVKFYENVFSVKMIVYDCVDEMMAFFPPAEGKKCEGGVSWAKGFEPSRDGVLISLACESIEESLTAVEANGGSIQTPKTKILSDDRGWFATFYDCEGNKVGLYEDLHD